MCQCVNLALLYPVVHKPLVVYSAQRPRSGHAVSWAPDQAYLTVSRNNQSGTSRPRLPSAARTAPKIHDTESHRPPRGKKNIAPHPGKRHGRFLRPTMPFFLWPEQKRGRLVPGGETQQAEQSMWQKRG